MATLNRKWWQLSPEYPLKEDSRLIDFVDTVIFLTDNFDDDNLLKLIQNIKDVG